MIPRVVDSRVLASYLGYPDDGEAMRRWIRDKLHVQPLPGRQCMWDLWAVNAAMNRVSKIPQEKVDISDPYEAWKHDAA